jgi:predicted nucleic-acid-binding protein
VKGLDTNLLVRFATREEPAAEAVRAFLIQECTAADPGYVNRIVLCELVWVLRRTYRYSRAQIAGLLGVIFAAPNIRIEDRELADRALARYRNGTADFSDYLLAETNSAAGCSTTFTLDADAAKEADFSPLEWR